MGIISTSGAATAFMIGKQKTYTFVKGDYLEVFFTQNSGANRNYDDVHLSVNKRQSPQTLAGGPIVAFAAQTDSGAAIGTSATDVVFDEKVFDSHGAFNASTGIFTAPESGPYSFTALIYTGAVTLSTGDRVLCRYLVNGNEVHQFRKNGTGAGQAFTPTASVLFVLNRGDTVKITAASSVATTLSAVIPGASYFRGFKVK
jgi:hypothetical protein